MVQLDLEPSNDARLQIASDLASRLDCHVIGIAAADPNPPAYGGGKLAAALIADERDRIKKRLLEAKMRFQAAMTRPADIEWRQALSQPNAYVAQQACATDLVITGLGCYGKLLDPFRALDPSRLVVEAGRPVLVVPPEVEAFQLRRVVIGWKNTTETRRAIWDALPLLRLAEYVVLGEIPEGAENKDSQVTDVVRWLERHDVVAIPRVMRGCGETGDLLQDMARDELADLMVVGAYGHSRLGEWMWGGVTQKLLTSSEICCLLAH
jgi:nucleotide-binding universal stress UspA family protein